MTRRAELSLPKSLQAMTVAALLLPGAVKAQDLQPRVAGEELTVYLVTIGYGDAIWQHFGHNAIRIRNSADGTDLVFNYGVFDFETPGFSFRFLRGAMLYWLEVHDFVSTASFYIAENRTIWLQELNFTPDERAEILRILFVNAREENRYYRYNYFRDNCSTRVAGALDRALGGTLRTQLESRSTGTTYREETLRLASRNVAIRWGMDLALGPSADTVLSAWQEAFIPIRLRDHLRSVTVERSDGSVVPFVTTEAMIFEPQREPQPDAFPDRLATTVTAGGLAALVVFALGFVGRWSRAAGALFALFVFVWSLATGMLGVLLGVLWVFTDHVAAYGNQNLLQTNPLALALAFIGPVAVLGGRGRKLAVALAWLLAGMSLFGLVMNILPHYTQSTDRIVALLLPVHLAIALTLGTKSHCLPRASEFQ